ncbi:MAG: dynamin family protein [Lachnospiraceae bacterium]|nr:dynamin family protein [Lachnospiraceae bacterium]
MSDFEQERNEYKNKVSKQKDAITNLIDLSNKHTGLFDYSITKQLSNYQKKCDKLYNKLDKNEFEIAIVGLEKAGKSTFGNALMENRILPDADERCTYTSTCIRYGNDRAVVKFYNSGEMDNVLRGYLKTLGVENVESYTYQALSKSEYNSIFNGLDERDKSRYENNVHQDVLNLLDNKSSILTNYIGKPDLTFEGEDLYGEEFKSYIVSPKVAVAVKEVSIESSKLGQLQNAVIYDVPGFDSPTSMHLEQTKSRMKEADAIILIASAEKPSFTAPALNMFQEVVDEDNVSLSDKLFIFGNRADAANTLEKNIQTLKSDARKWNLLDSSLIDERLSIGSAKAHLQEKNLIEGDFCVKKINEDEEYKRVWPHGDGIEFIYNRLVKYNEEERFPIIKKKIRKNNEELRDLFKELQKKYVDGENSYDLTGILKASTDLSFNAKKVIVKKLEEIRLEIIETYSKEHVLSKRLQDEVKKLFEDEETYSISQEDIKDAKLKLDTTSASVNVEKIDEAIREYKFQKIYEDFGKAAFSIAQKDHEKYYQRIVECFEESLNVNPKSNANYEKIHNVIVDFIEKYKKKEEDEFIYQSVIERFVRDLMEVLIRLPYTHEARLNKFVDAAEVLSGLVMFYNPGDAEEGYKSQFLSVAPKNQPLLLALVFHDYKDSDTNCDSLMNYIKGICKSLGNNPEIIQLVYSIVKLNPALALSSVKSIISKDKYHICKTDEDYARNVISGLREVRSNLKKEVNESKDFDLNKLKKYDFDFTNIVLFQKQYKAYFGDMPVRTYDNIIDFFEVDLSILEKFLVHASIPAIRIENPFVDREVQSITKLIRIFDTNEFDNMIAANHNLFMSDVIESFNMEMANHIANKAAVEEVEKILKTLDDKD